MRLPLVALLLAALMTGLPPTATRAQTSPRGGKRAAPPGAVKICRGVPIPGGYTIVAETTSPVCPDGAYLIRKEPAAAAAPPSAPAAQQQPAPTPALRPRRAAGATATSADESAAKSAGQPPVLVDATRVAPAASPSQPRPPAADTAPLEVGEGDVLRVDTNLVAVPVSVFDRQGKAITDLRREDFRVFENGVEQEIAHFEPTDKPFTVALLLDTSASTSFRLPDIKAAAIAFARQLQPQDRLLVMTFDDEVLLLTEATNDLEIITGVINVNARTGHTTRLYDALSLMIEKRLNQIRGRKAIVLFTDGVDTSSTTSTYESTVREVEELDALVFPVQYDTLGDLDAATAGGLTLMTGRGRRQPPGGPRPTGPAYSLPYLLLDPLGLARADYERAGRYLRTLADKTGGRLYSADDTRQLAQAFSQIAEELRRQYGLGYYPKTPLAGEGERRQIRVQVRRPDLAVRARSSYLTRSARGSVR